MSFYGRRGRIGEVGGGVNRDWEGMEKQTNKQNLTFLAIDEAAKLYSTYFRL